MLTERPNLSYARRDSTEHCLVEARRLAHVIEELLVEAARDPSVDAYSLRIAQGLARSLIDQLVERPASSGRLETRVAGGGNGRNGSGSAQVA
jgi:chemotaxis receptor (MCP) glutamine deamidase CheD